MVGLIVPQQAWVEMVDLPREMSVRGLKPASGPLARMRNKRLLLKAIKDEDSTITDAFRVGHPYSVLPCYAVCPY